MAFETNRPIAMFLRTGTLNDPFHFIQETDRKVSDRGIIVLREIPVNQAGFVFDDGDTTETDPTAIEISIEQGGSTIPFTQVVDPSADLQEFEYRVDYNFGVVSFDIESHAGLENVNISYVGKGAFFISASRIYSDTDFTQDGGQFPITLQNLFDEIDPTFTITKVYDNAEERNLDTNVEPGTISITLENELAVFQNGV